MEWLHSTDSPQDPVVSVCRAGPEFGGMLPFSWSEIRFSFCNSERLPCSIGCVPGIPLSLRARWATRRALSVDMSGPVQSVQGCSVRSCIFSNPSQSQGKKVIQVRVFFLACSTIWGKAQSEPSWGRNRGIRGSILCFPWTLNMHCCSPLWP